MNIQDKYPESNQDSNNVDRHVTKVRLRSCYAYGCAGAGVLDADMEKGLRVKGWPLDDNI
jgi:hypothetical protein